VHGLHGAEAKALIHRVNRAIDLGGPGVHPAGVRSLHGEQAEVGNLRGRAEAAPAALVKIARTSCTCIMLLIAAQYSYGDIDHDPRCT